MSLRKSLTSLLSRAMEPNRNIGPATTKIRMAKSSKPMTPPPANKILPNGFPIRLPRYPKLLEEAERTVVKTWSSLLGETLDSDSSDIFWHRTTASVASSTSKPEYLRWLVQYLKGLFLIILLDSIVWISLISNWRTRNLMNLWVERHVCSAFNVGQGIDRPIWTWFRLGSSTSII